MGVDARISGSPCQVLSLAERNMLTVRVLVALRQPEVDDVHVVLVGVVPSNQEIIRFNISVNNAFFVYFLNSLNLF